MVARQFLAVPGIDDTALTYTGAQTGAIDRTVESKLSDFVSVKDFGAVGDGVTDDTAAITAAAAGASDLYFPSGIYLVTSTVNLRSKTVYAVDAHISGDTEDIVLLLGGNSTSANNPVQNIRNVTRVSGTTTNPVVRILGAKNQWITVKRCAYIQLYADTDNATTTSCGYSSFWFNFVTKLEFNTNPSPSGSTTQWINENTFYLNRIAELFIDGTYNHNNNKFFDGSFEGGTITFNVGASNLVRDIRAEGGCDVYFNAGTNNVITQYWQSSSYDYDDNISVLANNGFGCAVVHSRWYLTPYLNLVNFTYNTLKKIDNGKYNVYGLDSSLVLGASSISASGFNVFYESDFIPLEGANLNVTYGAINKTAGGLRATLLGYDASKIALPSTGADFSNRGVSGTQGWGDLDSAVTSRNGSEMVVLSKIAKYIKIRISGGGSGFTADGLFVRINQNGSISRDSQSLAAAGSNASQIPTYEEGTFTPTFVAKGTDFDAVTYDAFTEGTYTRSGRVVNFSCYIITDSVTVGAGAGDVVISGLPYAASTDLQLWAANVGYTRDWAINPSQAYILDGTNEVQLLYQTVASGDSVRLNPSGFRTGSNSNRIAVAGQYFV
jgi:hypothetical protein